MIRGRVTQDLEARAGLQVGGADADGVEVLATVDTGFTGYLTLPRVLAEDLALTYLFTDLMVLADGTRVGVEAYEGTVAWLGVDRQVVVHCTEGAPLIGMSLLLDCLLTVEVVPEGQVSIAGLEAETG